jgi:hypothetical protein
VARVWMDGQWVRVVTPADLGCKTLADLQELCATAEPSSRPGWATAAAALEDFEPDKWPYPDEDPPDPL